MQRWVFRYFASFFLALVAGFALGCLVGIVFQMTVWQTLTLGLLGALVAIFLLFVLDFRSLSQIMRWLVVDGSDAQRTGLPQQGLWGGFVRHLTRAIRIRDVKIKQKEEQIFNLFSAFQSAPIGMMLLDQDKRLTWGNENAARYLGLSFPRDYEQHLTNLVRMPEFVQYLAEQDQAPNSKPLKLHSTLGKKKIFSIQMMTDSSALYRLILLQDITEQEQVNQIRRDFVANISHEIRTPLTVLAGFVETMQQLPLSDDERKHYLQLMAQQSNRIHGLVNDLLTLAKLENSASPKLDHLVNIGEVFGQIQRDATELSAGRHQLVFSHPIALDNIDIAGDASEIVSAMTNIVANAIRYTPEGGEIQITDEVNESGEYVFSVKDNGPGIEPAHIERLTERFYRVDRGRSQQTGGTGLGLAIVKHVMQRHDGRLAIYSQIGQGACFTLYFPQERVKAKTA